MGKFKFRFLVLAIITFCLLFLTFGFVKEDYKKEIERINKEIAELGLEWKAGVTSLTVLSPEEKRMRLGAFVPLYEDPEKFIKIEIRPLIPPRLDWRDFNGKNWLTSIKDQGNCGSCWAFTIIGTMESIYKIERNKPNINPDLSEQDLVSCSTAGSCGGGYYYKAAEYIKNNGVVTENCFPYVAKDTACDLCPNWMKKLAKILGYGWVTQSTSNKTIIENALQDGPLCFRMDVYSDFYNYTGGIYEPTPSAEYVGGHAIVLIGYNNTKNYWICKNSWGKNWGENGYFKIRMGVCETGKWVLKVRGVTIANKPPVLKSIGEKTTKEGVEFSIQLEANDADNDPLTYEASPLPSGAVFDSNIGLFTWTPTYTQAGEYFIRFSVSDGSFEDFENVKITVLNVKKGKGKF
ncbi:putative Ig domain-containing protein [Candidatus Aminicenantes bacterium AH-873-B07]|nr:putative Ig domain-containing protein [Candidatus Aminicenantes bacterium AH-873-B07]